MKAGEIRLWHIPKDRWIVYVILKTFPGESAASVLVVATSPGLSNLIGQVRRWVFDYFYRVNGKSQWDQKVE